MGPYFAGGVGEGGRPRNLKPESRMAGIPLYEVPPGIWRLILRNPDFYFFQFLTKSFRVAVLRASYRWMDSRRARGRGNRQNE
jgi:hypothetical protein